MGIVKSGRRAGHFVGRVVDAEDRRFLGQVAVIVGGGGGIIVAGAAILGLAIRAFWIGMG